MADLFGNMPVAPQGTPQQPQGGMTDLFGDLGPARGQQAPQPASQQPSAADRFFTTGPGGAAVAFVHNAEDMATFGLYDKIAAAVAAGASHLNPFGEPVSYSHVRQLQQQGIGAAVGAHPVAGLAGDVAGAVAGGGGTVAGLRMAERAGVPLAGAALRSLAPVEGQAVRNVAKAAAWGGGSAAANEIGHTGKIDANTAVAAATGAVLGPVVGKVATSVGHAVSDKAYALLASKLGLKPDELQLAIRTFEAHTGQKPSIAMLLKAKQQGLLRDIVKANPEMNAQMLAHQQGFLSEQPAALSGKVVKAGSPQLPAAGGNVRLSNVPTTGAGRGQSLSALTTARNDFMDSAIQPIRKNVVPVTTNDFELLSDPRIRQATANNPGLRGRLNKVLSEIAPDEAGTVATSHELTIDDIDALRQALRSRRTAFGNPANAAHNSQTAKAYEDIMNQVSDLGVAAEPKYGQALDAYRADSNYITGFKHGSAGNSIHDVGDQMTISKLATPEGQAGHAAGITSHYARKASASETGAITTAQGLSQDAKATSALGETLSPQQVQGMQAAGQQIRGAAESVVGSTPQRVTPETQPSAHDAIVAAIEGGMGMKGVGTARGARFISRIMDTNKLSPTTERKMIEALTTRDPVKIQKVLTALKRAGATDRQIYQIANAAAAIAGAQAGQAFVTPGSQ